MWNVRQEREKSKINTEKNQKEQRGHSSLSGNGRIIMVYDGLTSKRWQPKAVPYIILTFKIRPNKRIQQNRLQTAHGWWMGNNDCSISIVSGKLPATDHQQVSHVTNQQHSTARFLKLWHMYHYWYTKNCFPLWGYFRFYFSCKIYQLLTLCIFTIINGCLINIFHRPAEDEF